MDIITIESYEVNASRGLGRCSWPTNFAGTGYAVLVNGEVVSRHGFRCDALAAQEKLEAVKV